MKNFKLNKSNITQKEKSLLLQDLSARLYYGVKIFHEITDETGNTHTYDSYVLYDLSNDGQHITLLDNDDKHGVCDVDIECGVFKPYLRPMSSMTEEENKEYLKIVAKSQDCSLENNESATTIVNDWYLSKGFDVRGLIPKGLALVAPKGMYETEEQKN